MTLDAAISGRTETEVAPKRWLRNFFGGERRGTERAAAADELAADDASESVLCDSSIVHMMLLLR
jgi:hypothetical protein